MQKGEELNQYLSELDTWELLEIFKNHLMSRVDEHAFVYREYCQFSEDMKIAACLSILNMGYAR